MRNLLKLQSFARAVIKMRTEAAFKIQRFIARKKEEAIYRADKETKVD
jgi:hypothetical protein